MKKLNQFKFSEHKNMIQNYWIQFPKTKINKKRKRKKIESDLTNLEREFLKIIKELSEIDEGLAAKANAIQLKESEKAGYYNQLYTLLRQNTSPVISEADKKKVHDLTFKFDRADEELSFLIGDLVSS